MPTENRSSNTELQQIEAAGTAMTQIRTMLGREQRPEQVAAALEACDWSDTPIGNKAIVLSAVRALRAPQPHPEPIAWMVGTAFWWTKEEAERDAEATGLPIVGLGPMIDTSEAERLVAANTEYARRHLEQVGEVERLRNEHTEAVNVGMRYQDQCEALRAQLEERDALLTDIEKRHWSGVDFDLPADLVTRIKAISLSAEPEAPGKQGAPLKAVRANDIQDLLDRAATAIGQYGDSLLGRGQREDSVDLLDLEREVRDLEQEFRSAFALPGA